MVLFINSCPRKRGVSRTLELCDCFIEEYLQKTPSDEVKEIALYEKEIKCLNDEEICRREKCFAQGDKDDQVFYLAKEFAEAEKIIIGAPYWDLSFPSALKVYTERICVNGITFQYTSTGPEGLSKSEKMMYITTAGGYIGKNAHGSAYMRSICEFVGAGEFVDFSAEGLDIVGNDAKKIIDDAKAEIRKIAKSF